MQSAQRQAKLSRWIIMIVLLIMGVAMITPFILMLSISFDRGSNLSVPFPPRFFPLQPSLFNFKLVFQDGGLGSAYLNTLIVTVSSVVIKVCSALLAGYAFSKGTFRGKKILFILFLATMMIPLEARLISLYLMWHRVHLLDTFWPLILPNVADAFMMFLAKQFFDELPDTLREASHMDGAGEIRTFLQVYLPLTGPIIATMVILSFIYSWNDFLWPLIVLTSDKLHTIQLFVASFSMQYGGSYAGMSMAVTALATIPVLVVFIFLQKYVIQSIALSGLKGE